MQFKALTRKPQKMTPMMLAPRPALILAGLSFLLANLSMAQDLEPRRWSHLPVGSNFSAAAYAYTNGNIFLDPSLSIEGAEADVHTLALGYVHAFDFFGKSGRIDLLAPYSSGRWEGTVDDEFVSVRRRGFGDPKVRFAVNLIGSPAQRGAEFQKYKVDTIVGVAVEVTAPLGEYREEKLINLGTNRWLIKPQIGVVHNQGKWTAEITGAAWFFTDNDEFTGNSKRRQDPLYSLQTHLIYTFRPGLWTSLSGAYGGGGRPSVDGTDGDRQKNYLWAVSFGLPIDRRRGVKLAYLRGTTSQETGIDYNRFILAYSMMWGGS
jgi:hypothetical protein